MKYQYGSRKKSPQKNPILEKISLEKISPENIHTEKILPGKKPPRKKTPWKSSPKLLPIGKSPPLFLIDIKTYFLQFMAPLSSLFLTALAKDLNLKTF